MKRFLSAIAPTVITALVISGTVSAATSLFVGSLKVPTGGTITDTNATSSSCVGTNGSKQYTYGTNCVTGVSASGNLSSSGGATPNVTMTASPSFTSVTSTSSMTSGTVGTNNSGAFLWGCSSDATHFCAINADSTNNVQSVNCGFMQIGINGVSDKACIDSSGNAGFVGNVTAANFFNGSKLAYKQDVHPLNIDAIGILKSTDWASYRYKPQYGDPNEKKIGFVADYTPAVLSGDKHDHFDAGALATVDAKAILQLESVVRGLCHAPQNRKEKACRAFVR